MRNPPAARLARRLVVNVLEEQQQLLPRASGVAAAPAVPAGESRHGSGGRWQGAAGNVEGQRQPFHAAGDTAQLAGLGGDRLRTISR